MKQAKKDKSRLGFNFIIIVLLFVSNIQHALADETEKNILIIHQYAENYPYQVLFDEGLENVFSEYTNYNINYDYEHLKIDQFPDNKAYLEATAKYFQFKRENTNLVPDVIITTGLVDELLWDYKDDVFADIPIIKVPLRECTPIDLGSYISKDGVTKLCIEESFDKNIELILNTQKSIKKFYVVIGSSYDVIQILKDIKDASKSYEDKLDFEFLNDLSYSQMLAKVKGADKDSSVLFVRWFIDVNDQSFVPKKVLDKVIEVANVPVYGTQKHYLGTGIVGGYLSDISLVAEDAARLAISFIEGKATDATDNLAKGYSTYAFDARVLKRWNIDTSRLPSDSKIEFEPRSAFREYRAYIMGGLTIMVIEAALIIGLITNYKKRIKAEIKLIKMNTSLEKKVAMRTQELKATISKLEELNRELEYRSGVDSLTRVCNRRNMEVQLNEVRNAYIRTGNIFSVMMLDIDDFKQVNDKYGHYAGDEVLKMLAKLLEENVRKYDKVSRWGGEEFLLLFPGLKKDTALMRAEAIRKTIEEAVCIYDCKEISITVTIGVATIENNESVEEVVARADEALYLGKNTGKNRVMSLPKK